MDRSQREQMTSLVEEWRKSKLNINAFARKHQIRPGVFRYWVKKNRKVKQVESFAGFIPLPGMKAEQISLRYPNGVRIQLPADTPLDKLQGLIYLGAPCFR